MSVRIGVDMGGTKTAAAWVDHTGRTGPVLEVMTQSESPEAVIDSIVDLVGLVEADLPDSGPVDLVGIGIAGLVDVTGRIISYAVHLPLRDHPTADVLERRLGTTVTLENDATAAAWAEHTHGAGRAASSTTMVSIGTGLGGGIVVGDVLVRGATGAAGEVGHIPYVPDGHLCTCGAHGCWEQYASGRALGRYAREAATVDPAAASTILSMVDGDVAALTGRHVSRAAEAGDQLSLDLVEQLALHFGWGLAGVVATLDPEIVVVGGGVSSLGDLILEPARQALADRLVGGEYRNPPELKLAELGSHAALIGAASSSRPW